MSTLSRLIQIANDAAKVYEGRDRYIRAIKALKQIEKIYRSGSDDSSNEVYPPDQPSEQDDELSDSHRKVAEVIADVCKKNGGIWVKFAQYLSCRADLLPVEYIDVLQDLQYSGAPTGFTDVCERLDEYWGSGWEEGFSTFDLVPVATASIAQVYKATLKTGESVAVKILIPGIEETFEQDSLVFRSLSRLISPVIKEVDIVRITEHLIEMTLSELSFIKEMGNIKLFDTLPHSDFINIPKVMPAYCNEKILMVEWVDGELLTLKLQRADEAADNADILEKLVSSMLEQIFKFGIFHADPHPGNIIVSDGKLTILDFGLVGKLNQEQKNNFLSILITLVGNTNLQQLPALFEKAGFSGVEPEVYEKIADYIDTSDDAKDLDDKLNAIIHQLRKHRVFIPESFIALARVLIIISGVVKPYNLSMSAIMVKSMR